MGASKIRKSVDPLYGIRPQRSDSERGLIVSPPIHIDRKNDSIDIAQSDFDSVEIRSAILYWDKLIYPKSTVIEIDPGEDADFLKKAGVLDYYWHTPSKTGCASILMDAYINAFYEKEKQEPGVWSLSQGDRSLSFNDFPSNLMPNPQGGISMKLMRHIPIPAKSTPLEEILNFKMKRKDELESFRKHIDNISYQISMSPDNSRALERGVKEIEESCGNLIRVARESGKKFTKANIGFSINLPNIISNYERGWNEGELFGRASARGLSILYAALGVFNYKPTFGFDLMKRNTPYRYVIASHEELSVA